MGLSVYGFVAVLHDRTKAEEPDGHEESPGEFLFQP
jgi:hypothetical protein